MRFIRSVRPVADFRVLLGFDNGESKEVDLASLLRSPIFEPIRNDPELFRSVRVDDELGTIVWPNGADLDPDVLYGAHLPAWLESSEDAANEDDQQIIERLNAVYANGPDPDDTKWVEAVRQYYGRMLAEENADPEEW